MFIYMYIYIMFVCVYAWCAVCTRGVIKNAL